MVRRRWASVLLAGFMVATLATSPVAADRASAQVLSAPTALPSQSVGGVAINDDAAATRDPAVTISVAPPAGPASRLRVSNDGGRTAVEIDFVTAFAWSLVDPAAGGTDTDEIKTVTIEAGDGSGEWAALGSDDIFLDRVAPTAWIVGESQGHWKHQLYIDRWDEGSGVERAEYSLDNRHWAPFTGGPFDFRLLDVGGSWDVGTRTYYGRVYDRAGNISDTATMDVLVTADYPDWVIPARFEFPRPAVSGQLFTIRPVFEPGYRVPAHQFCEWRLNWGDETRMSATPNEYFGSVIVSQRPVNGRCGEWTFTLPYTQPLGYTWVLCIAEDPSTCSRYVGWDDASTSFHATRGTTERRILHSSIRAYSVVPDDLVVASGAAVRYHLYGSDGATPPRAWWMCDASGGIEGYFPQGRKLESQLGGTSFTCHPTTNGPWVTTWYYEHDGMAWGSAFDPVSDRHKPVARVLSAGVATGSSAGAAVAIDATWSGSDNGSGVFRYEVQIRRDGGSYRNVPIANRLARTVRTTVSPGHTYRLRVRAVDRAGNIGAWAYGPDIRAVGYQDVYGGIVYAGPWRQETGAGFSGGSAHICAEAGSSATLRLSGRSVGWMARRAPGRGFAQVWVDGTLAATIDLASSVGAGPAIVWRRTWSSVGLHEVRVVVLGTVGRPDVGVDAFVVLK